MSRSDEASSPHPMPCPHCEANAAARATAERMMHALLRAIPGAFFLADARGAVTLSNDRAERMFGYEREMLVGEELGALVPAVASAGRIPEPFEARLVRARRSDGTRFEAEIDIVPLEVEGVPFAAVQIEDVSERRAADEAIRAWERRYAAAVEATELLVYDLDLDSGAVTYGTGLEPLLGRDADEMSSDPSAWEELVVDEDREALSRARRRLLADGEPVRLEYRMVRRDGAVVAVRDEGRLLTDADGRPSRVLGFVTDVSADRELHEQLRQAQKMEGIGRLAGGVAHDFNNILTVIRAHTDFALEDAPEDGELREDLVVVRDAARRASDLTRQLLLFSRREVARREAVDLNELVLGMERMLARMIDETVALDSHLDPELPEVQTDPAHIEQVLMNLVVNARDAMIGGGRITVRTAAIEVAEDDDHVPVGAGSWVCLTVADTGTGMDEETLARVFDPFFTTKERGKGTGLGLSTVYGIVTGNGGEIRVDSVLGEGTRFDIWLPAGQAEPRSRTEKKIEAEASAAFTLLVIEDEESLREVARRCLEDDGHRVLTASGGEEALAVWEREADGIDLVVTDVVMPHMSGREVVDVMRARRPELRVLYMSGYAGDKVLRFGVDAGAVSLLGKPFNVRELCRAVRRAMA